MEIALLHYAAPPVIGGVEHVIEAHALLMADAGHSVRVIAGRGGPIDKRIPFLELPLADSRNAEILAAKSDLDQGSVTAKFHALVDRLEGDLGELISSTDILIAHNVCSLHKNLALTAALRRITETARRPRLILWHHDLAWTAPRYRAEVHAGYPWDLLRTPWPGATQVCVSEWRRAELAQLLGIDRSRIHVIPNGVAADRLLKLAPESLDLVRSLHLIEAAPLILLPVRITPRKNIEKALEIVAAVRRVAPAVRLVVTGPLGPHNPANLAYLERVVVLRRQLALQSVVHILAEVNPEPLSDRVISDLFSLADVLLLTSSEEGFGIPILEAGLARIPVFCTDIQSLRELGAAQVNYFSLSEPPQRIAAELLSSLNTSPQYRLRKRVLSDYTWEHIYARYLAPLLEMYHQ